MGLAFQFVQGGAETGMSVVATATANELGRFVRVINLCHGLDARLRNSQKECLATALDHDQPLSRTDIGLSDDFHRFFW